MVNKGKGDSLLIRVILFYNIFRMEIKQLLQRSYIGALFDGFFFACTKVIILLTILTYALIGGAMTAKRVYLTVALHQTIRLSMTLFVPLAFRFSFEALVTLRRLEVCCFWFDFHLTKL